MSLVDFQVFRPSSYGHPMNPPVSFWIRLSALGHLLLGTICRPALARLAALATRSTRSTRGAGQLWEPMLERQFSLGAWEISWAMYMLTWHWITGSI